MTKSNEEIRQAVEKALRDIQTASGRLVPPVIEDLTMLEGFKSLNSVEAALLVGETLGWKKDIDFRLFWNTDTNQPDKTVSEIVEKLSKMKNME